VAITTVKFPNDQRAMAPLIEWRQFIMIISDWLRIFSIRNNSDWQSSDQILSILRWISLMNEFLDKELIIIYWWHPETWIFLEIPAQNPGRRGGVFTPQRSHQSNTPYTRTIYYERCGRRWLRYYDAKN
jgi:hypothetical protein